MFQLAAVITPYNYTLDVLKVFLHHLRDDPTTLPISVVATRIGIACFSATQGLMQSIQNCPESIDSPLRQATVQELFSHHERILAWFEFILSSPLGKIASRDNQFDITNPIRMCTTLRMLLASDSRLQEAMASSYSTTNVLLAAWNARDPKGEPYISFEGFVDRCHVKMD